MLALWAPEEEVRQKVLAVLDPDEVRVAATWPEFRVAFDDAGSGLVAVPEPRPDLFGHLQALRSRRPGGTLVLALRRNPRVLRRLKDVIVEEVVWMDELAELPAAVQAAETQRRLQRMERRVRNADHLPSTLVDAIVRSLSSRPPLTSVQDLSTDLDRDRRTLWHHWRNATSGERSGLTLKGFLDWIVLLRAASMKTENRSWHEVADEIGVHPRTLRRVAQRRTGESLRDLSPVQGGGETFFTAFRDEAIEPLLASPGNGASGANGRRA